MPVVVGIECISANNLVPTFGPGEHKPAFGSQVELEGGQVGHFKASARQPAVDAACQSLLLK